MIPKPGKNHLKPENYRPISLLNTMSKIFEKLILQRLKRHIQPRKEQHAFRSGHSTTTQLITLMDDLAISKITENIQLQSSLTWKKHSIAYGQKDYCTN